MSSITEDEQGISHTKPGKKKAKPSGPPEETIQQEVENYLTAQGLRYLHILKDILIILDADRVLILVLKRKGGRLRQPQKNWLKGITHHVPDTLQDAITLINTWRTL